MAAAFEPDGYVREPSGGTHRGTDELRAFYELLFSDGGGLPLELRAVADDGRACALEYNVIGRGEKKPPPRAGIAVHVRDHGSRLAAARVYDDVHVPATRVLDRRTRSESRDTPCR